MLRAAVDSQSGSWFDDIHANVERVTREGMQRADTLQVGVSSPILFNASDAAASLCLYFSETGCCVDLLTPFSETVRWHPCMVATSRCNTATSHTCNTSVQAGLFQHATLQMQMESQQGSHTHRLEEASAERDRLAAHLTTALDSCRQLEAELQQSRCAF